jgi:hypothetical protein
MISNVLNLMLLGRYWLIWAEDIVVLWELISS